MHELTERKINEYAGMTELQRQQELMGLFTMLPDFNLIKGDRDDFICDPVNGKLRYKDPEEFERKIEGINRRSEERLKSPFAESLRNRLNALLKYSQTTESFCKYITSEYDEYMDLGIDREGFGQFNSDLAFLQQILQWGVSESAGVFSANSALIVDRNAYTYLRNCQMRDRERTERLNNPDYIRKIMGDEMAEIIARNPIKTWEEELANIDPNDPTKQGIRRMFKQSAFKSKLVKKWRLEYIEKYGDEP